jgi:hypothetical protein
MLARAIADTPTGARHLNSSPLKEREQRSKQSPTNN